jgi:hypothetical protein
MGKIYVGQTALRIQLTANVDINTATPYIKYQKPDGTVGQWEAGVINQDTGTVYYDIQASTDLDQEGEWIFWIYLVYFNSTVAAGEPVVKYIYAEGD